MFLSEHVTTRHVYVFKIIKHRISSNSIHEKTRNYIQSSVKIERDRILFYWEIERSYIQNPLYFGTYKKFHHQVYLKRNVPIRKRRTENTKTGGKIADGQNVVSIVPGCFQFVQLCAGYVVFFGCDSIRDVFQSRWAEYF